ncbi:MAG: aldehyde ferredoxin oxidoreductase family protein [Dehalococcoidia bacterium]|nr:aldehyde ferredoxin oxidoreductase family protein [Dehalococcoidia bacterium]
MYGWSGKLLRVDLSKGGVARQPLDEAFALKWLGGEGFGAKILWDGATPQVADGLDERNLLIFSTGVLTGTPAPASGRLEIVARSAITGIFGDSNSGGHFAPALKQAGYDALIIEGKAAVPVYLWIDDDRVEIRDARHLWGRTVPETEEILRRELGADVQIACIGPGGENLVRFAVIVSSPTRVAGWGGVGAVAGSKRLKAVVVRGTKGIRVARPQELQQACWEIRLKAERVLSGQYRNRRKMGTMELVDPISRHGMGTFNNFGLSEVTESHLENISGEKFAAEFAIASLGCYACGQQCSHFAVIKNGPYKGIASEGFEFGSLGSFLMWYGSTNMAFGIAISKYCTDYGVDASEVALLLAWAADCLQKGILTEKDTDGLALGFGDERAALELLRRITFREGFGDLLAEGLARAAKASGKEAGKYAYTIKGRISQEATPRGNYACALATATSTRGADHLKGWPIFRAPPEVSMKLWGHPEAGNPLSHEGKAAIVIKAQHLCTLQDILGTCKFYSRPPLDGLDEHDYARILSPLIGVDLTGEDLMGVAERVWNLEKAFNVRSGMSRKDDTLPQMFFDVPYPAGPLKGFKMEKEKFEHLLDEYYRLRGWDVESSIPTRSTLERLGLGDVADEMERRLPSIRPRS